jgi:hypothetical protein
MPGSEKTSVRGGHGASRAARYEILPGFGCMPAWVFEIIYLTIFTVY